MWYSSSYGLVRTPRSVTVDGVQHPRQIFRLWSKPELAAIGFYPARISVPDSRYHNTGAELWAFDNETSEWVCSYAITEKDPNPLKEAMITQIKRMASSRLAQTDWMSIREQDGGTAMHSEWKTYRADIRQYSNTKESEVNRLSSLQSIKDYDEAGGINAGWPDEPVF